MSACTFVEELPDGPMVPGYTAFAEKGGAPGKDTALFLPLSHRFDRGVVDVVLWFHGHMVPDVRDLLHPAEAGKDMKLRQSVKGEKKDVVFVAPWLGLTHGMTLGPLGQGDGCQVFLDQVLDGVTRFQKSKGKNAADSLTLGNLIVAGHSAGGAMMKAAIKCLGAYRENLKEVWGFDCFYDADYPSWSRENPWPLKVFYVGNGSGGGGSHAFGMMKEAYGASPPANLRVAPAVDRAFTGNDTVAFQGLVAADDWSPAGRNVYTDVRAATDRLLGADYPTYWSKLRPLVSDHFQVVRDLLGPRVRQSRWLKAAS